MIKQPIKMLDYSENLFYYVIFKKDNEFVFFCDDLKDNQFVLLFDN